MNRLKWLSLLIGSLGLLLSACQELPQQTPPTLQPWNVDGKAVSKRYQHDQAKRHDKALNWSTDAVLDLELQDQGRRNRITMLGSSDQFMRLRAMGPFQQIALELQASTQWIRLLDLHKKSVTQVPATAIGLEHLIEIPLAPTRLLHLILGWGDELAINTPFFAGSFPGIIATTQAGEVVHLDITHGLILKRSGEISPRRPYKASYTWPTQSTTPKESALIMPERIQLQLENPTITLEFIFNRWSFPADGPPARLFTQKNVPGFSIHYPLSDG